MGTLTNEQYLTRLNNKHNGNIIFLEDYVNTNHKILHHCNKHDLDFYTTPRYMLQVNGCPECSKEIKSESLKASCNRKTKLDFIYELEEINDNIEIIGEYIDSLTNILCKCKTDGHEWMATPSNLLRGTGCPRCSGRYVNDSIFRDKMKIINPNIEILDKYVNSKTKLKCRCKIDGNIWYANPNNLYSGKGCPKCGGVYRRTHDEFVAELYNINPDIIVISEFKRVEVKIKCKCAICDSEWDGMPRHLLEGIGCPYCTQSKGEKSIQRYLDLHSILYEGQYKYDGLIGLGGGLLSYDFFLTDYNLLIEYQGIQHKKPINFFGCVDKDKIYANFIKQQKHDKLKRKFAMDSNIKLLEIWYWDFKNIEEILNKELIKSNCGN